MRKLNDVSDYAICSNCGTEFLLSRTVKYYIRHGKRKHVFCSNKCDREFKVGENNPAWRGGRKIGKGGYIYIYQPNHPRATVNNYVLEHRLVMENHMGRILEQNEIVHHKNENKKENVPENLDVCTQNTHAKIHNLKRKRDNKGRWVS